MVNFWISLIFLLTSWGLGLFIQGVSTSTILLSAVFFGLYFLLPLLNKILAQTVYLFLPLLVFAIFYGPEPNGFMWLIYLTLAFHASDIFEDFKLYAYLFYLYLLMVVPPLISQEWLHVSYVTLFVLIVGTLYFYLSRTSEKEQALIRENKKIQSEFKQLNRQLVSGEEMVRQEERNQIAREIHDSVGHRLTALLMQVETARIQAADEEVKDKFQEIKKLAQSSLYETREAVKTLKSEETSGIQAVIQLIRKLEVESQLRLSIIMQSGVLGAVLSNQQSVAIYRAIQEALTNMMRHSNTREASIEFQIVAQRDFRFQISHPLREEVHVQEGFGLMNMRERIEAIEGKLTIEQSEEGFHIIGQFPLEVKEFE